MLERLDEMISEPEESESILVLASKLAQVDGTASEKKKGTQITLGNYVPKNEAIALLNAND